MSGAAEFSFAKPASMVILLIGLTNCLAYFRHAGSENVISRFQQIAIAADF